MSVNPRDCLEYEESMSPAYNPFDKPPDNDNSARIKALVLVQPDIIKAFFSKKEALVIDYVICKQYSQKAVAEVMGVGSSTVCKQYKQALKKLRTVIAICDKAIRYYQEGTR